LKFGFIFAHRSTYRVKKIAKILNVSESGFHAWAKRFVSSYRSEKDRKRDDLATKVLDIFTENYGIYGFRKIKHELRRRYKIAVNCKTVIKIMRAAGIMSKVATPQKEQTTDSNHNCPVAGNLLQRQFYAALPNQKWVSDITYIETKTGWLYHAAILDLCGRKVVGSATSERIDTDLVVAALQDAVNRAGKSNVQGCLLHSDRGSVYCSKRYQNLLKAYGIICSMSRKGNCWDNAPMECFWSKMKREWLNDFSFETREEASSEVFKYVWTFYNRKRIHETNGYMTPDEYYDAQLLIHRSMTDAA
jgi:putative transposase